MSGKSYSEVELYEKQLLCTEDGQLNRKSIGWSRIPLHTCNLKWNWRRPKRWNYWCITCKDFLLALGVSDRGFTAVGSLFFLEYEKKHTISKVGQKILNKNITMPDNVYSSVSFEHKDINIFFKQVKEKRGLIIEAESKDGNGKTLKAKIYIEQPESQETLNVVIPWSNKKFQFTSKQECLPGYGEFSIGKDSYIFEKGSTFATHDFGRGFWPRKTTWNWGAASGYQKNYLIGLNLGGKWTDGTGYNENGYFIDGKLYKISEDLDWEYDRNNFMIPWVIKTSCSDNIYLTFKPFFERSSSTNWILYKRSVHQIFGHYKGYITNSNGEKVQIKDLMGWAEELTAVW